MYMRSACRVRTPSRYLSTVSKPTIKGSLLIYLLPYSTSCAVPSLAVHVFAPCRRMCIVSSHRTLQFFQIQPMSGDLRARNVTQVICPSDGVENRHNLKQKHNNAQMHGVGRNLDELRESVGCPIGCHTIQPWEVYLCASGHDCVQNPGDSAPRSSPEHRVPLHTVYISSPVSLAHSLITFAISYYCTSLPSLRILILLLDTISTRIAEHRFDRFQLCRQVVHSLNTCSRRASPATLLPFTTVEPGIYLAPTTLRLSLAHCSTSGYLSVSLNCSSSHTHRSRKIAPSIFARLPQFADNSGAFKRCLSVCHARRPTFTDVASGAVVAGSRRSWFPSSSAIAITISQYSKPR